MQRNQIIAAVAAAVVVVALVALLILKPWKDSTETAVSTVEDPAALTDNDRVVARVNGTDIRMSDVVLAEEELGASLQQIPEQVRFQYLLGTLIDRRIVTLEAKKTNTAQDPLVKTRVAYSTERAIRDVYWVRALKEALTEEKLLAYYNENIANRPVEKEAHAAHILVDTKEQAEKILADLKGGKSFADLAKEFSKDGSKANGGDIGWYKKSDLVPAFGDPLFKMKPGETSAAPVKSEFGWHIIHLFELRDSKTPTFEESRQGIMRVLARPEGEALLSSMRKGKKIELVKQDGSSEVIPTEDDAAVPAPAERTSEEEAAPATEEAPAAEETPAAEEAPAEKPAAE